MPRASASAFPIGLDIGARFIKAVQFGPAPRAAPTIRAAASIARAEPDAPLTAHEAGRVLGALSRQGFAGTTVVAAVPRAHALSSVLELPPRSSGAPLGDIARAELARTHRCDPTHLEMAMWDLPSTARAAETSQVMAVACRHVDADALLDSLESGGATVLGLDSPSLALTRAAESAGLLAAPHDAATILDLGFTGATLCVAVGGLLVYERAIPEVGIAHLRQEIIKSLGIEPDVADYLIEHSGLSKTGTEPDSDAPGIERRAGAPTGSDSRQALLEHIHAIAAEARASMSYATRRYAPTSEPRLLVAGGGAMVPGLIDALSSELQGEATVVRLDRAGTAQPSSPGAGASPANALAAGLALYHHAMEVAA